MTESRTHLGTFRDLVETIADQHALFPVAHPGPETQEHVRDALAFTEPDSAPLDVRVDGQWERDGVSGEAVSWSVGFGPRTEAWVLKPVGMTEALPGVLALHCHSGFKYFGKEKIADGPSGPEPGVLKLREKIYGGRAFANELAKAGFVVLVPDVFLWGSRRFPLDAMPDRMLRLAKASGGDEIERYNAAARFHEDLIARYCALLGTTLAGIVSAEDRIAVRYLHSRSDVLSDRIGCVGLSGGGCRAALLQATCDDIRACVVTGMMSTHAELLDRHVASHTWMFFPAGWSRYGDWPDLAGCRTPSPLLVQYLEDDDLFPLSGMQAADERITAHYSGAGHADAYEGHFFDGPHRFDQAMQETAFDWLASKLT